MFDDQKPGFNDEIFDNYKKKRETYYTLLIIFYGITFLHRSGLLSTCVRTSHGDGDTEDPRGNHRGWAVLTSCREVVVSREPCTTPSSTDKEVLHFNWSQKTTPKDSSSCLLRVSVVRTLSWNIILFPLSWITFRHRPSPLGDWDPGDTWHDGPRTQVPTPTVWELRKDLTARQSPVGQTRRGRREWSSPVS